MPSRSRAHDWGAPVVIAAALGFCVALVPATVAAQFDDFFGSDATDAPKGTASALIYERFDVRLSNRDPETGNVRPNATSLVNTVRFHPTLKVEKDEWSVVVSALATQRLQVGQSLDAQFDAQLFEGYYKHAADTWDLRAGQMLTRWGRGVVSIFDILNPADMTEWTFIEDEFAKQPIPMIDWTIYDDEQTFQLIYIPFYRPTKLADSQTDWSLLRSKELEDLQNLEVVEQSVEQGFVPGILDLPKDNFVNGEIAASWRGQQPSIDYGAYFFYGWEDLPMYHFTEDFLVYLNGQQQEAIKILTNPDITEVLTFNPLYRQKTGRQLLLGVDVSTLVGPFSVRGELEFISAQSLFTKQFEIVRAPMINALAGIDSLASTLLAGSLNVMINVPVVDADVELLQLERLNSVLIGVLRSQPFEESKVWLEARGALDLATDHTLTDGPPSAMLSTLVGTYLNPNLQLHGGLNLLSGEALTAFGSFDGNDFLFLRLRYSL